VSTTPRHALLYILTQQAQKEVTHAAGLNRLDALVQPVVQQIGPNTPPGSPATGAVLDCRHQPERRLGCTSPARTRLATVTRVKKRSLIRWRSTRFRRWNPYPVVLFRPQQQREHGAHGRSCRGAAPGRG
jgi:hypothetical protein